jgi:hypothetical protein
MKVIYVAGPYRSRSPIRVLVNIIRAWLAAAKVWRLGAVAICPHTNALGMTDWPLYVPIETILQGEKKILYYCDAMLLIGKFWKSPGTRDEMFAAWEHGIPIFDDLEDLARWLKEAHDDATGTSSRLD